MQGAPPVSWTIIGSVEKYCMTSYHQTGEASAQSSPCMLLFWQFLELTYLFYMNISRAVQRLGYIIIEGRELQSIMALTLGTIFLKSIGCLMMHSCTLEVICCLFRLRQLLDGCR